MKIEMGESLIYSWLRHEKLCQLVQTNWKVSPFWELENRQDVETLFVICRNYFLEKHSFDISKGCSLEQFLKQAEIDGIISRINDRWSCVHILFADIKPSRHSDANGKMVRI